jgi:tetratricopeptide (TPR) repeat protein
MSGAGTAQQAYDLVGRDPRAALAMADAVVASLPRPRTQDDVREIAVAQRAAALALRATGDPAAGERRLRRTLAIAERHGEDAVAAELRMTLAFVLLDLGRYRAALAATDHALAVLRGAPAARVRTIRALVLHRAGRFREASAEYDAALRVLRRAGDDVWQARLRQNRALLSTELGDTVSAIADLEWSRRHSLEHGDTVDATDTLFNMGVALEQAGDVPGALALFDQAESEWVGVDRPELWLARVDAYLGVGLVTEARANARSAVSWLDGRGWDAVEAHARLQLALCHLVSEPADLAAAQAEGERARAMFVRAQRLEAVAQADYVVLTARLRDRVAVRELAQVTDVVARLRDSGGDAQAADLRITAGRVALELGELDRARQLLGPLTAMDRARQLDVRTRAWLARALLAHADGDPTGAERSLRRAWSVVEQQRALLGATELRAAAATHSDALVTLGLELAVATGSPRGALDWAERGRAAALRYRPALAPRDPELARALSRLRWAARAEEEGRLDGDHDPEVRRALTTSEEAVRRAAHRVQGSATTARPVHARDIAEALDGQVYAQLVEHGVRLHAVVLDGRNRPALIEVAPVAEIRAAADAVAFSLRRLLTGFGTTTGLRAAHDAVRRGLAQVEGLFSPVLDRTEGRGLVVCPSRSFTGVPWSALPSLRGRRVTVAPSATLWHAAVRVRRGGTGVVAVAGPGLPGAEHEVVEVARVHAQARTLGGASATVAAVIDAAATASVLHVAAHGALRRDNPLFSSLELADGPLTGYELEAAARVPALVVLSACSSGAGHAALGEETLGLAWTLLALGAATVVAPLHPVPDQPTTEVMVALHQGLAAGCSAADSLTSARVRLGDDPLVGAVSTAFVAYGA